MDFVFTDRHAYLAAAEFFTDVAELERIEQLLEQAEPMPADPYSVALIYAGLGDKEQAVKWLEGAFERRFGWFILFAKGDTRIDGLRGDPRVKGILQRMRLEP